MSALDLGPAGYGLLALAILAHEPWRWLGLAIGASIDPDGELFRWVRAVANAIVAALVMRILVFPTGALTAVPLGVRLVALAVGIAAFYATGRSVALGILAGAAAFIGLDLAAAWR